MKNIDALKKLQQVDSQIFTLKKELEEKPKQISALESGFSEVSAALKQLEMHTKNHS